MIRGNPAAADVRFLALGDSYTIGEAVGPEDRWPVQLVGLLRARGTATADPEIVARTGWTTDELSAGIDAENPRRTYTLVSLLIGVNDQYRGRSAAEYRRPFRELVTRAVELAAGVPHHVVVLSIPDWGVTPFAAGRDRTQIGREIDQFNAVNREEALRAGARYVDVTRTSRRAAHEANLLASDGLHPSAAMYVAWAHAVLPAATAVLDAIPSPG